MGTIATFYSFKGGVGRTMALANIAALLCKRGKRVLAVDWDLEAPGLDKYFTGYPIERSNGGGLLELLMDAQTKSTYPDWREFVSNINLRAPQKLSLISCNTDNKEYVNLLSDFSWSSFFEEHGGGAFIESLRDDWKSEYDVTLVDSRTGLTDAGGVCTIQLPDVLVAVFSANNQSFYGVTDIIRRAQAARQQLAYDRMPLTILPLPSRFDSRTEFEESQAWLDRFAEELADFYKDWLPSGYTPRQVLGQTKVPHVAFFSFGEKLPVITQGVSDPDSIGFAFDMVAELIGSDFQRVGKLLDRIPSATDVLESSESYDVFISYANKDKPIARDLAERLQGDGLRVWFDEWMIRPGDSIPLAIETGLENARTLIFVMSSNVTGLEWATLERQTALFRDPANRGRRFVPLKIDDAPLPEPFKAYAYVDWRRKDESEYRRIVSSLGNTS
uniref:CobQ/CobB/MinD/ParA nucleotide binding domain-containing protein n=1 Tax=Candidatus Kentrum sp. FW TaxID=2126338 RepID=A0A450TEN7_9GAMM|nr:MAG: CobQ/CobB/MinD/ParA nucleotide binding domain-containing protein [Candidatus Kentron sp. FW]